MAFIVPAFLTCDKFIYYYYGFVLVSRWILIAFDYWQTGPQEQTSIDVVSRGNNWSTCARSLKWGIEKGQ